MLAEGASEAGLCVAARILRGGGECLGGTGREWVEHEGGSHSPRRAIGEEEEAAVVGEGAAAGRGAAWGLLGGCLS